jgi:hypothetical protein
MTTPPRNYECRDPDHCEDYDWWPCEARDAEHAAELYAEEHDDNGYYLDQDGRVLVRDPEGRETVWTLSGETTTIYTATAAEEAEQ